MTLSRDYRARAAHVRRSARAQLKEIRRARLARKEEEGSVIETTPPSSETEGVMPPTPADETVHQDVGTAVKEISAPAAPECESPQDADSAEHAALSDMFDEAPDMSDMPLDTPAEISAPLPEQDGDYSEKSSKAENTSEHEATEDPRDLEQISVTEDQDADQVAAEEPEADLQESDLNMLPGAGPGLIWMLHQCGVRNLADLAASDPEVLTPKLGVVGQILDVSKWIDFASGETSRAH